MPIPAVAIPAAIALELVDPPDATSEAHAAAAPIVETVDESILSEANASVSTYEVSGDNREITFFQPVFFVFFHFRVAF